MHKLYVVALLSTVIQAELLVRDERGRRDLLENLRKDDPGSKCRNGGIFAGGQCHCIHPHTGDTCQDYACVHGMSVGRRYDPTSLMFNKPCICNDGWSGDLCEYHLTDRCSGRGEWKDDHCACIGHFFGSECQYTSRCDQGTIKHGRCICHKDWEGEYCHQIVCHHGYPDVMNNSKSCVCPAQYKGIHCDQCSQVGPKIEPYPRCIVSLVPRHALLTRKKTKSQIKHRLIIILCSLAFLGTMALIMYYVHYKRTRNRNPEEELARQQALDERSAMLLEEARKSANVLPQPRKKSITQLFRLKRELPAENHLSLVKKESNRRVSLPLPFRGGSRRANSISD